MRLRTQKRASGRRITKTALMLGRVVAALALIAAGCGGDENGGHHPFDFGAAVSAVSSAFG